MFPKIVTIFVLLTAAVHSAMAQIDFTPQVTQYTAERFTHSHVTFKNDQGSVTFDPPDNWTITGDKARVRLSPPAGNFAEATIQTASLSAPGPFDDGTIRALEQQALQEVPPGSQSVQVVNRIENPIVMSADGSFGFLISYQAMGYNFQRSVVFVNLPDQRLVFRFTAPKADFEKFLTAFHRSLGSWQWKESMPAATVVKN